MPAKNPRLTVTLEPQFAAQLRRLSELTGDSQSKIIAQVLEGSTQVFAKIIRVLEAAEKAKDEVRGRAASNLEEAQGRMEAQLQLVMGEFDEYTGSLLEQVEAVSRRARRRPAEGMRSAPRPAGAAPVASVTPPSNRGVRSTNPTRTGTTSKRRHG